MTTREDFLAARPGRAGAWRVQLGMPRRPLAPVLASMDALSRRLGCSAPNRMADRAGRYRRLAVALALLPIPLVAMGLVVATDGSPSLRYASVHLAVALSCGWLAVDLVRRASVVDHRNLPLASSAAVLVGLALLANLRPDGSVARFGPSEAVAPAVGAVVLAFATLVLAERLADDLLSVVGRWVLVVGVALLGVVELVEAVALYPRSRPYAAGLGAAASLLVLLAFFEARVLVRGLALFRLASRR